MDYARVIKKYDSISLCKGLNSFVINDVNIWSVIRKDVYNKLLKDNGINETNHTKYSYSTVIRAIFSLICSFFSTLKFFLNFKKKKFLFLGFSRREYVDGVFMDCFHDPIIDELSLEDCFLIERPFKGKHFRPRYTKSDILDYDFFSILVDVACYIYRITNYGKNNKEITEFCNLVNSSFGKGGIINKHMISQVIFKQRFERLIATMIVNKLKPKKMVVTSRWRHFPFIYSAQIRGIEVIEIQHGAILRDSMFYKELDDGTHSVDTMFTFSDFWNDYPWGAKKRYSIGKFRKDKISKESDSYNCRKVLVVSQPELWSQLDEEVYQLVENNKNLEFVVKLHPQDTELYETRYKNLYGHPNVRFIDNMNNEGSFKSFMMVIGYKSTLLYEAYSLGANVGLICNGKEQEKSYEFSFGSALKSFSFVYIDEAISKPKSTQEVAFFDDFKPDFIRRYFYEKSN